MRSLYFLLLSGVIFTIPHLLQAQKEIYELDNVYPLPTDGILELQTNDAEITITGMPRSDVHLVVYREATYRRLLSDGKKHFEVEVTKRGDRLLIRDQHESYNRMSWHKDERYLIEIEVPEDVDLVLKGDDDDYLVRYVNGDITLRAEDGDAQFENCGGKSFDFYVDNGTVYMNGGRGNLKVVGEDGEYIVEKGDFNSIYARMDDGALHLATRWYETGNYEIVNQDGSLHLDILEGGGKIAIKHDDGEIRTDNQFGPMVTNDHETLLSISGGDGRISIKTDDGDILLRHLRNRY